MDLIIVLLPIVLQIIPHSCRSFYEIETDIGNPDLKDTAEQLALRESDENNDNHISEINQILKLLPFEANKSAKKAGQQYLNVDLLQEGTKDIPIAVIVASPDLKEYYSSTKLKNKSSRDFANKSKDISENLNDYYKAFDDKGNTESHSKNNDTLSENYNGHLRKASTENGNGVNVIHNTGQKSVIKPGADSNINLLRKNVRIYDDNGDLIRFDNIGKIRTDDIIKFDKIDNKHIIPPTTRLFNGRENNFAGPLKYLDKFGKVIFEKKNDRNENDNLLDTFGSGNFSHLIVDTSLKGNQTFFPFAKQIIKNRNAIKLDPMKYKNIQKNSLSIYDDTSNMIPDNIDEERDLRDTVNQTLAKETSNDDSEYNTDNLKLVDNDTLKEFQINSFEGQELTNEASILLFPEKIYSNNKSERCQDGKRLTGKSYNLAFVFNK